MFIIDKTTFKPLCHPAVSGIPPEHIGKLCVVELESGKHLARIEAGDTAISSAYVHTMVQELDA